MHMGQHDEERLLVNRTFELITLHADELKPRNECGEPLQHVWIGRKIAELGDDAMPLSARARGGGGDLEDIHRGGVAHDGLVRRSAYERSDARAETRRDAPRRAHSRMTRRTGSMPAR